MGLWLKQLKATPENWILPLLLLEFLGNAGQVIKPDLLEVVSNCMLLIFWGSDLQKYWGFTAAIEDNVICALKYSAVHW